MPLKKGGNIQPTIKEGVSQGFGRIKKLTD